MSYAKQIFIAFDNVVNTLLKGKADETISARAYRCGVVDDKPKRRWVLARHCIDVLFFWQSEHCRGAYISQWQRRHMPSHYQGKNPFPSEV